MKEERLDKLLAAQGIGSRKEIKELVRKGGVIINGSVVKSADVKIAPDAEVLVQGKPVLLKKHVRDLLQFRRTVFYPADFMESVEFDRFEIEIFPEKKKERY